MKAIKKHGRKMVVAAAALAATFTAAPLTKSIHKSKCDGTERWEVKTLKDEDAGKINFSSTKTISIEDIITKPRDSAWSKDEKSPRLSDEFDVYTIKGKIIYVKEQKNGDGDIHIELSDGKTPEHVVIAEIPNPACPNVKNSDYVAKFKKPWNDWLNKYQDKSVYSHGTFEIKGVVFHDTRNHGNGGNENGVELHPVISIKKL